MLSLGFDGNPVALVMEPFVGRRRISWDRCPIEGSLVRELERDEKAGDIEAWRLECGACAGADVSPRPYAAMMCSKLRSEGSWLRRLMACTLDCIKVDIDLSALMDSWTSKDDGAFVL